MRAWSIRSNAAVEQWDAALIKGMLGSLGKPNLNQLGLFMPVHIGFYVTVDVELDGHVGLSRNEAIPRMVDIQEWMM